MHNLDSYKAVPVNIVKGLTAYPSIFAYKPSKREKQCKQSPSFVSMHGSILMYHNMLYKNRTEGSK